MYIYIYAHIYTYTYIHTVLLSSRTNDSCVTYTCHIEMTYSNTGGGTAAVGKSEIEKWG